MKFTLVSSNMWLLPPPLSVDNKKRISLFTNFCLKRNVDFICLQEVWLNEYVKLFLDQLKSYYFVGKPDFLYNKTGLLFFSKYKPVRFTKYCFKISFQSAFFDLIGRKGYLHAQFKINGEDIEIYNIHLNSPYRNSQKKIWHQQMDVITTIAANRNTSLIIAGDFNGPYDLLLKESSFVVNKNEAVNSFSMKNSYRLQGFHKYTRKLIKLESKDLDIDGVLYFEKYDKRHVTKQYILNPLVSDHYPVYAEIE